jgi:hypothetical protein
MAMKTLQKPGPESVTARRDTAPAAVKAQSPAASPPETTDAIRRIEREAQSLSSEEHKHLHSHLVTETSVPRDYGQVDNAADAACFKRLIITFQNLRANSKATLSLRGDRDALWSEGVEVNGLVGLSLSTNKDPAMYVRNFVINPRELSLQTYQDSQDIQIQLYVRTQRSFMQGRTDLPPGASVIIQSTKDRTSVIGLSAFALDLD